MDVPKPYVVQAGPPLEPLKTLETWEDFPRWDSLLIEHLIQRFGDSVIEPSQISKKDNLDAVALMKKHVSLRIQEEVKRFDYGTGRTLFGGEQVKGGVTFFSYLNALFCECVSGAVNLCYCY